MNRTPTDPHVRQPRRPFAAPVAHLAPATIALLSLLAASTALRADEPHDVRPQLQIDDYRQILDISFSADGRYVIASLKDGTAVVRESATGTVVRILAPNGGWVTAVALTRRGEFAAVGTKSGSVGLWDVASGREVRRFRLPHQHDIPGFKSSPDWVRSREAKYFAHPDQLRFSPDDVELVGVTHRQAACWNVASGRLLRVLDLWDDLGSRFSRSTGHLLVAASRSKDDDEKSYDDSALEILRTSDFVRIAEHPTHDSSIWHKVASEAAGIVAMRDDRRLAVRDLRSGRLVAELPGPAWHLDLSADGRTLAAKLDEGVTILRVDADSLRRMAVVPDLKGDPLIALSDDGRLLAVANDRPGVWSVERGRWLWRLDHAVPRVPKQFVVALTRPVVHAYLEGGKAMSWDVAAWNGPHVARLELRDRHRETSLACNADGSETLFAAGGVRRSTLGSGAPGPTWPLHGPQDRDTAVVAIDASGTRRAYARSRDKSYRHDVSVESPTGRIVELPSPDETYSVDAMAFDSSGKWLAVAWSRTTHVYSTDRALRILRLAEDDGYVRCLAYDEDHRTLVTGTSVYSLSVWDPTNGKRLRKVERPGGDPCVLALSDDARSVACGTEWGELQTFDIPSGRLLRSVVAHDGGLVGLGFESGRRLWTAGADGFVKVWTAEAMRELARIAFLADGGWIVQTPDGRFDGSPGCEKHVAYIETGTLRVRTDDGLAARFRRPGLLKQVLAEHDAMR